MKAAAMAEMLQTAPYAEEFKAADPTPLPEAQPASSSTTKEDKDRRSDPEEVQKIEAACKAADLVLKM